MGIAPLCIIQVRLHSSRLPSKMVSLDFGGESLIARAWRLAKSIPDWDVVIACPPADVFAFRAAVSDADILAPDVAEWDVLGRFYHVAHRLRWHPDSIIVRWTPDDPFKDPMLCQVVAGGKRLPVETSCEAFTLAQLDAAWQRVADKPTVKVRHECEHITDALFPFRLPPTGVPGDTIDTPEDYEAALRRLEQGP